MKVANNPEVLIIQLMRYDDKLIKNTNSIVPSYNINFNTSAYHLKAIIQHQGEFRRGHYTTLLNLGTQWRQCNDQVIKQNYTPNDSHLMNQLGH